MFKTILITYLVMQAFAQFSWLLQVFIIFFILSIDDSMDDLWTRVKQYHVPLHNPQPGPRAPEVCKCKLGGDETCLKT